jgi:hypothetical protein
MLISPMRWPHGQHRNLDKRTAFNDAGRAARTRGGGKESIVTAHKPAQVVRHAAIVLAGAASLSLTVASGAYIVNQMADTHRAGSELSAPPAPGVRDVIPPTGPGPSEAMLTGGSRDLPAIFMRAPADIDTAAAAAETEALQADPAPSAASALGGKLRLGTTYIGAQLAPVRADTVALSVDTNALTTLTNFVLSEPIRKRLGVTIDPAATTRVRTEFDTHGEVTLTFSDPTLGDHSLRANRYTAPAPENTPSPAVEATPPAHTEATTEATVPETPAAPEDSATRPA